MPAGTFLPPGLTTSDVKITSGGTDNYVMTAVDGETIQGESALQFDGSALTVGANTDGYDVQFFGATSGAYMHWDESRNALLLRGAATFGMGNENFTPVSEMEILSKVYQTAPTFTMTLSENSITTDTVLANLDFRGTDRDNGTTGHANARTGAQIRAVSDEGWGTDPDDNPTRLEFRTQTDGNTNEMATRMRIDSAGGVFINETANGNMTTGLTINQGAADNQILALKSSDPSGGHGLTDGLVSKVVEIDDYVTFQKQNGSKGGVQINVVGGDDLPDPFFLETYGGPPDTSDTSSSGAAAQFFVAEHDGANAVENMAADSNAFAWGEISTVGGGRRETRMLLKADDGELHLGNSTLVALDDEDDRQIIRAIQKEGSSSGIIESKWDNPFYDYDKLHELGLAGKKDETGFFLFPVQSRLHAHEGAMWQNYTEIRGMQEKIDTLENRLLAIEGAK